MFIIIQLPQQLLFIINYLIVSKKNDNCHCPIIVDRNHFVWQIKCCNISNYSKLIEFKIQTAMYKNGQLLKDNVSRLPQEPLCNHLWHMAMTVTTCC